MLHRTRHHEERTPPEVERRLAERLVHRDGGEAVARDAAPLAERLVQRLAEHEAHVLHRVVVVHVEVARALHREVHERVLLEQLEHVVEEADARVDLARARPVEVERQRDVRLFRLAFDERGSSGCVHGGDKYTIFSRRVAENVHGEMAFLAFDDFLTSFCHCIDTCAETFWHTIRVHGELAPQTTPERNDR